VKDDEDNFTFWAEAPAPGERKGARALRAERPRDKLYPDTIRAIFERVTDAAAEALGRPPESHPRRLVLRVVPVPPNTVRPGVRSFGGAGSSYHDSTNLLQHLVKRNGLLPERPPDAMGPLGPGGPVDGELDRAVANLQQIYYDFLMGSSATSVTQGSRGHRGLVFGQHPVRSLLRNLPRKQGRIRANLLGKRVFYISRSTISGNTRFRPDEVGVPLEFARTLQVEEVVQEYNRDWLMPFFLNGRRQYPGCTHLVRAATREVHDVANLRDLRLEVGDVLYRDVINGDAAYFNRAPTLERSSIGVHRIVVIQDPSVLTFQMNVLACEWYNKSLLSTGGRSEGCCASLGGKRCKRGRRAGYNHLVAMARAGGPVAEPPRGETAKLRETPDLASRGAGRREPTLPSSNGNVAVAELIALGMVTRCRIGRSAAKFPNASGSGKRFREQTTVGRRAARGWRPKADGAPNGGIRCAPAPGETPGTLGRFTQTGPRPLCALRPPSGLTSMGICHRVRKLCAGREAQRANQAIKGDKQGRHPASSPAQPGHVNARHKTWQAKPKGCAQLVTVWVRPLVREPSSRTPTGAWAGGSEERLRLAKRVKTVKRRKPKTVGVTETAWFTPTVPRDRDRLGHPLAAKAA
jgi:hypothetical protein